MSKVKIGILGAGFIAKVHADNLKKDERVDVVGVVDLYLEKAQTLAKEVGPQAKAFGSLEELRGLGVDAVYVTTPNTLHVEPVLTCLESDLHVFSEKPMATSLSDAQRIKEAAAKSKGIYNLGMNMRYGHVFKKVKEVINSGAFTPYLTQIKLNRGELLNPTWTADPKVTGGFLYETPIHLLDMCQYLFGEVETVKCEASRRCDAYDSHAVPAEVRSPRVEPRMEKRDLLARLRVLHEQASALVQGAGNAGQCEIFQARVSADDCRQDMVNVESRLLTCLSEAAILATIPCPLDHLPPQGGRNDH